MENIQIQEGAPLSAAEISHFIGAIFDASVASEYSSEGVEQFKKYIEPEKITERLSSGHFTLFAIDNGGSLVGLLEMRNWEHLSMLFIREDMQRKGIGRQLLSKAIEKCHIENPDLEQISTASSPNSVGAYQRMGFEIAGEEKAVNGLRFTPMVLRLDENTNIK